MIDRYNRVLLWLEMCNTGDVCLAKDVEELEKISAYNMSLIREYYSPELIRAKIEVATYKTLTLVLTTLLVLEGYICLLP